MVNPIYWSDNWFQARYIDEQLQRLRRKVTDAGRDRSSDLRSILTAIDQLEVDIGRTLLKLHALVDVLEEKGLVTAEELAAKARKWDEMDGDCDGVLHPAVFRTEQEQQRTGSPRALLIALEKQMKSPREFLAELENSQPPRDPDQGENS